MNSLLGAAWEEAAQGSNRTYYRLGLHLGFLPEIHCRIVESRERPSERHPSHVLLYSSVDGETLDVGAFWPRENAEGKKYLTGYVNPSRFGLLELRGGAKVDFRLVAEQIPVRLSAVKERHGDRGPTHQLWRMTKIKKAAQTVASEESEPAAAVEMEESVQEEDAIPE